MSNRSLKALPQQSKAWWQAMKDQDLSVLQQQNQQTSILRLDGW